MSYGTVQAFASQLGRSKAANLLEQTLREERSTDEKLTGIAESSANLGASRGSREGHRMMQGGGGDRSHSVDRGRSRSRTR